MRRELLPYGRFPYWPQKACGKASDSPNIASEIWFWTRPLDEETILKLDTVRLFTESQDQGLVDDRRSASYSWFDLVIMNGEHDMTPRKIDGVELAWRSHSNCVGENRLEILDGSPFRPQARSLASAPGRRRYCRPSVVSFCRLGE